MSMAAANIYWVIVALWAAVFSTIVYSYATNPRTFGTTRLLLFVIGVDTLRNIVENVYFGMYFGAQYGLFSHTLVDILGDPRLLIVPKLLNVIAGCVVLGLLLYRWLPLAISEWNRSEQRADDLTTLAAIDPLTGLYNRREFEERARAELARSQRYMRPLSLLLLDIDHFKLVNDQFGHEVGDRVLWKFAETVAREMRETDIVGRVGGEEFALLLPETTKEAAKTLAERLCDRIRVRQINDDIPITVSIGVAGANASTSGIDAMMREADSALYEAKRAGRDRAMMLQPRTEILPLAAE